MKCINTSTDGAREAIIALLLVQHEWLICCTAEDPEEVSTFVLENVTRYEIEGRFEEIFKRPVFIEYGISKAVDGVCPYRIHDSMMCPIKNGKALSDIVNSMIRTFDVVIVEDGIVDRKRVYGKLGTDHSNEIVFLNEDCERLTIKSQA